jgi:superfamily II DNA or RNA helicase
MIGQLKNWLRHRLGGAFVVYNKGTEANKDMSLTLRPHQAKAIEKLAKQQRGQIIVPTGGGKTIIGIMDVLSRLEAATSPITIVVVAPRILLAQQLQKEYMEVIGDSISNIIPAQVNSGETHHFQTTKPAEIRNFIDTCKAANLHSIIFTTYQSLGRVAEASVQVDTFICDEAHNSVQRNYFPAVKYFSEVAERSFFYTATPKHSATVSKAGMNDTSVYGQVLVNVPAPELVRGGFIVPPRIVAKEMPMVAKNELTGERDCTHLIQSIVENNAKKVLVCAKSVANIQRLFAESDFAGELKARGYSYMYISAKTGGVIDGQKVNREEFFLTLNAWGRQNDKKFVVLHHSILSEGINVSGLEAVVFMRSMDYIGISQTIGRVIRLHKDDAKGMRTGRIKPGHIGSYTKSFGLCIVPVYSSSQRAAAQKVQNVVDLVFEKGEAAVSVIKR